MLVPVVCFSCGFPIGDREDIFLERRGAKVRAARAALAGAPPPAAGDSRPPHDAVDCCDILDALGVHRSCCRKSLVAATHFLDVW